MNGWFWLFVATYIWSGFWVGALNAITIDVDSTVEKAFSSVFFAVIWPLALPLFLGDIDRLKKLAKR